MQYHSQMRWTPCIFEPLRLAISGHVRGKYEEILGQTVIEAAPERTCRVMENDQRVSGSRAVHADLDARSVPEGARRLEGAACLPHGDSHSKFSHRADSSTR